MNSKIDQAVGGIKKAVGSATGNEKMQAEGMAQNTKGQAGSKLQGMGQQVEQGKDELKNRLGGNNTTTNTGNNATNTGNNTSGWGTQ